MSVKLLQKYIEICNELNKEPTVSGLMAFKEAFK